jgi:Flp pilus assembly protein CpaB
VDVIASFKVDASDHIGRAVSTTLLQNIQVLGVESNTVVNKQSEEGSQARSSHTGTRRTLLVTLMVDSTQAEALQLAIENGAVSLAMRNPNDVEVSNGQATLLSEGKLAQLADLLSPKMSEKSATPAEASAPASAPASTPKSNELEPLQKDAAAVPSMEAAAPKGSGFWQIEVIRGMARTSTPITVQN